MQIKAICNNCKKIMDVNCEVIKREEYKVGPEQKSIWLIYYDCPICLERHYVQADDESTTEMLFLLTGQIKALAALKQRHATISKKRDKQVSKLRTDLEVARNSLMIEYEGAIAYSVAGNEITIRFSV